MKFLGILSLPRSGTNHLSYNILSSNSRVLNLGEIFHNIASEEQRKFIHPLFSSFGAFRSVAASDPTEALRRITNGLDADIAIFKIFPDHLDQSAFDRLALEIDGFVVLTRNPLSTWVSNQIALESGIWFSQSTDDRTISWNAADFIDHSIERLGYLNNRVKYLRKKNIPFVELTYTQIRHVENDPSETMKKIAEAIPSVGNIKLNLTLPETSVSTKKSKSKGKRSIFKQDARPPLLRMEDWELAYADLNHWGLEWLADEDASFDRVALVNIFCAIRKVRARESEMLEFERDKIRRELDHKEAEDILCAEAENSRTIYFQEINLALERVAQIEREAGLRTGEAEERARLLTSQAEAERARHLAAEAERVRAEAAAEQRLAAEIERGVRLEHANGVLTRAGALMAEELRRTAARPWRPLKRAVQGAVLKFALLFRGLMSDRTVTRLRRSLAKRKPRRFTYAWEATLAQAWGNEADVDPLLAPVVRRPKAPLGTSLAHRLLLGLAAVSAPFSERRAERFRHSAAKRNPYRFRADLSAEPLDAPLSADQNSAGPVADAHRARRILVADYRIPRPDLSAGEKATFGLIADLRAIGFEVTFLPTDMTDASPYREALEALGVTVITRDGRYSDGGDYIRSEGARFGAFYFIRVDVAEALLQSARLVAPDARVIFHAPDLYFLRETRSADLSGGPAAMEAASRTRARETAIMQASDHVVLVSPAEIPFLTDVLPRSRISVFPAMYSPVVANPVGHAERRHIFFLGGFKHPPNVTSVKWFVEKVWPAVHARLPGVEFHIVGAEAPADVIALGERPGVRFVGYVKDLDAILVGYRLGVAPLLYGAGIKGKLGAAMGAGVPCVSTMIAAEGMGIVDGVHALVRDEPAGFAEAVVTLYDDPLLWEKIADQGRRLVEDRFGDAANQSALCRVLDNAGALPLDMYAAWCQAAEPAPLPVPDPDEPVDVSIIVPVHNQWPLTRACLSSVLRAIRGSGITCEVILADDASTDETLQAASLFPGLRVVRQDRNLGFLGNCNAAAAEARGEALLFLNNDTIVLPGWLTELVRVLREEPSAAIVGSKLLYPDGTIQEAGGVLFTDASAGNLGRGKPRHDPMFAFDREVDYSTGASILVRRSFWDSVGGFDTGVMDTRAALLDLSLSAREADLHVVCAARSEAIQIGSAGAAGRAARADEPNPGTIRSMMSKRNIRPEEDYLAPDTPLEIAAAHAERMPFLDARRRRKGGKLNVLYFSPFPSHPDNHGNQATIQSFGKRFQKLGHKVHFALLQSSIYDASAVEGMRSTWDTLDVLPNTRKLWANGNEIPFDGWYEPGLGENIRLLCQRYDIDVVFCSYVFQSKLLEFVPSHVLKVIDTHDKMGDRYEMLRKNGQPLEFFSCTPEQEGAYLRRADVVVARRAEEAAYFNSVSGRQTAIVIPHFEEPRFQDRRFGTLRNVGLVASANRINLAIMLDFVRAVDKATKGAKVPFQVHIAGQVRDMIRDLPPADQTAFARDWITLHGFVPDIADFYAQMDLIVSPVTMGTGINVKTVQAMAFGMPLLTTAWGCKGIETGDPMHSFATLDDLVGGLMEVSARPEVLEHLAQVSRDRYTRFQTESLAEFGTIIQSASEKVRRID